MLMMPNNFTRSLQSNITYFRNSMMQAGFKVLGDPDHPICPIFLGDAWLVILAKFFNLLLKIIKYYIMQAGIEVC